MKGKRRKEFKRRGGNADQIITSISILSVSLCLLIFLTIISLTVFELKIKVDQTYKDYKLKELESKVIVTDTTKIKEQTIISREISLKCDVTKNIEASLISINLSKKHIETLNNIYKQRLPMETAFCMYGRLGKFVGDSPALIDIEEAHLYETSRTHANFYCPEKNQYNNSIISFVHTHPDSNKCNPSVTDICTAEYAPAKVSYVVCGKENDRIYEVVGYTAKGQIISREVLNYEA